MTYFMSLTIPEINGSVHLLVKSLRINLLSGVILELKESDIVYDKKFFFFFI